jgi:phosphoenolpyruvate carboxylase
MALSKREARIAAEYSRLLKLERKAKSCYERLHQRTRTLALKVKKPARIAEGQYLVAEDCFSAAIEADNGGEDSTLWGHGSVRRWKLIIKNLD